MERIKINALYKASEEKFRSNLIKTKVEFKQLGSAFVIPRNYQAKCSELFDGLWTGFEANIEQQVLNDDDFHVQLYVH